jgi:hypothetical protein
MKKDHVDFRQAYEVLRGFSGESNPQKEAA